MRVAVQHVLAAVTADFPERCKTCKFNYATAIQGGGFCLCQRHGWRPHSARTSRQVKAAGYNAPLPQAALNGNLGRTGDPELQLSAAELVRAGSLAARAKRLLDLMGVQSLRCLGIQLQPLSTPILVVYARMLSAASRMEMCRIGHLG